MKWAIVIIIDFWLINNFWSPGELPHKANLQLKSAYACIVNRSTCFQRCNFNQNILFQVWFLETHTSVSHLSTAPVLIYPLYSSSLLLINPVSQFSTAPFSQLPYSPVLSHPLLSSQSSTSQFSVIHSSGSKLANTTSSQLLTITSVFHSYPLFKFSVTPNNFRKPSRYLLVFSYYTQDQSGNVEIHRPINRRA